MIWYFDFKVELPHASPVIENIPVDATFPCITGSLIPPGQRLDLALFVVIALRVKSHDLQRLVHA